MAKIVLVSLYSKEALGLRYLSSLLNNYGHEVKIIFLKEMTNISDDSVVFAVSNRYLVYEEPTKGELEYLMRIIEDINPDVVGISLRTPFYELAKRITYRIKERDPKPIILWGGIHPTISPEECIEHADIICRGEGEYSILELVRRIENKQQINDIPNLWIRDNEKVYRNDVSVVNNLDSLPFPDYSMDGKYYIGCDEYSYDSPWYEIMASRGCMFSCSFCCNNLLKKIYKNERKPVRIRSVKSVIEELKIAKKRFRNLKCVNFQDEIFPFDDEWVDEFCKEYKKHINVPFFSWLHPSIIKEEFIAKLRDAGLIIAQLGIQSGSERIKRKYLLRNESNKQVKKAAQILNKYNISTLYNIILDIPFEKIEDAKETLNLLLELPRPFGLEMYSLCYFPDYEITKMAVKGGYIKEGLVDQETKKSVINWYAGRRQPSFFEGKREKYKQKLYELLPLTADFRVPKEIIKRLMNDKEKLLETDINNLAQNKTEALLYQVPRELDIKKRNSFYAHLYDFSDEPLLDSKLVLIIEGLGEWVLNMTPIFKEQKVVNIEIRLNYPYIKFTTCSTRTYDFDQKICNGNLISLPKEKYKIRFELYKNNKLASSSYFEIKAIKKFFPLLNNPIQIMKNKPLVKRLSKKLYEFYKGIFHSDFPIKLEKSKNPLNLFDTINTERIDNFYILSGWHRIEEGNPNFRWTKINPRFCLTNLKGREKISINFQSSNPNTNKMRPVVGNLYLEREVIEGIISKKLVGKFKISEKGEYNFTFSLPKSVREKEVFSLLLNKIWSPSEFEKNDSRKLGIAVNKIWAE